MQTGLKTGGVVGPGLKTEGVAGQGLFQRAVMHKTCSNAQHVQ